MAYCSFQDVTDQVIGIISSIAYMFFMMHPHYKKSSEFRSGECEGQIVGCLESGCPTNYAVGVKISRGVPSC
jgi:hypothetical protein